MNDAKKEDVKLILIVGNGVTDLNLPELLRAHPGMIILGSDITDPPVIEPELFPEMIRKFEEAIVLLRDISPEVLPKRVKQPRAPKILTKHRPTGFKGRKIGRFRRQHKA